MQVTIRTARLPGPVMGLWDERARTVWLDDRLTPAERRCTLAHELLHAERGDVPCGDAVLDARQELRVEGETARRLLPLAALRDVLRWSTDPREAAAELGVDAGLLAVRLHALSAAERAWLAAAVAAPGAA